MSSRGDGVVDLSWFMAFDTKSTKGLDSAYFLDPAVMLPGLQ